MAQICETCKYKDGKCYCSPNSTCKGYEPEVDVNEYANFNKLADLYIKDTACDGQLFCGSRREDCENYKTEECRKCLIKHLNDIENNKI